MTVPAGATALDVIRNSGASVAQEHPAIWLEGRPGMEVRSATRSVKEDGQRDARALPRR